MYQRRILFITPPPSLTGLGLYPLGLSLEVGFACYISKNYSPRATDWLARPAVINNNPLNIQNYV
jgi:hypothetical protein